MYSNEAFFSIPAENRHAKARFILLSINTTKKRNACQGVPFFVISWTIGILAYFNFVASPLYG
jgi:hypothetical protein